MGSRIRTGADIAPGLMHTSVFASGWGLAHWKCWSPGEGAKKAGECLFWDFRQNLYIFSYIAI